MSVGKRDNLTRFQTVLALLILNGMVKTKLAILPILCCEEIVKNSFKVLTKPHLDVTPTIASTVKGDPQLACIQGSCGFSTTIRRGVGDLRGSTIL